MGRVNFIEHQGKRILHIDMSNCAAADVLAAIADAKQVIGAQPPNSLLTLTDVTGSRFDDAVSDAMKQYTAHNKPFVRSAAVVGVTGLKKIVLTALVRATGRDLKTFDDFATARDWLAQR